MLAVCEPRSRLSERTLSQEEEEEGQNKTHCTAPVYPSTPHTHITCKYYTHAYTKVTIIIVDNPENYYQNQIISSSDTGERVYI